MPILRVTKNEKTLCSVGSEDVWMFSASVNADIWGPERSTLTITGGGKHQPDGSSEFLIWEMAHELLAGDRLAFAFEDGIASSTKGKSMEDEPTPEDEKANFSGPVLDNEIARLQARPRSNTSCAWRFAVQGETEILAAPDETRECLTLHLLWNEMRAHRMRVSLSKSSFREIASKTGGEELFLSYVEVGARVEVAVEI